ncbi:tetratricopeptide repeat protein [Puia sp. P3]|uniref:tetratricopeptide repeat protein n=1 Tax=Puia sp. P3 TaxID=3423952 RepID=UPI003D66C36A
MLTLATLYMYRQLKPSNIYRENFYPYVLTSDRSEKEQDTLSSAYKKGHMTEVRAIFSTLRSPSARDYFLAANSFLALGKPDSAIASFRKLLQLDRQLHQHEFEEDTEYYLAMSYLRAGLIADALPLFRKIQAEPQHPYHDKVGSWLIRRLRWAQ